MGKLKNRIDNKQTSLFGEKKEEEKVFYDEPIKNDLKDTIKRQKQRQKDIEERANNPVEEIEKQKSLSKELERIQMIENKFIEYGLNVTKEEIDETYKRLNINGEWVTIDGCKFHTIFLKVMEYEMKRDDYKETYISHKNLMEQDGKTHFTEEQEKYKKEIEENTIDME